MKKIRLALIVSDATRKSLKVEAAKHDLDMSDLGQVVLDYTLAQLGGERPPPALLAAIDKFKRDKAKQGD